MPRIDAAQLTRWRLRSLGLSGPARATPVEVARHLLAVQSQDHAPSCWSIGQRTRTPSATRVDAALASGDLLRLHVLRPTWHTVAADDVAWLTALTAPGVERVNARAYAEEGLTPAVLADCAEAVAAVLAEGISRTRPQLGEVLGMTSRQLGYVMHHLELRGLVCSGPPDGTRQTYALVSARAPDARVLDREEALVEIARRYATGHGPVTPHDLGTWATLPLADARRGLAAAGLAQVDVEGVPHWHAPDQSLPRRTTTPRWRLLQLYDELVVGYRHAGHVLGAEARTLAQKRAEPQALVLRDEQVVGRWRRTVTSDRVRIEVLLRKGDGDQVRPAVEEHARFLGREAELVLL